MAGAPKGNTNNRKGLQARRALEMAIENNGKDKAVISSMQILYDIWKVQVAKEKLIAPLAAAVLGMLPKASLDASDQLKVQRLGQLWTQRMQYSGISDWSVLLHLQELEKGILREEGKSKLFEKLYPLLASNSDLDASFQAEKELQKAFWSKLK